MTINSAFLKLTAILIALIWNVLGFYATAASFQDMLKGFILPPDSTKTKVWWFHGEVPSSSQGIVSDLTSLKNAGVGGVVYYDQVHGDGENADPLFSLRWWQMLKRSAHVADSIGLSFEINASNGYVAGGSWITPDLSMQRVGVADSLVTVAVDTKYIGIPEVRLPYFEDIALVAVPADICDYASYIMTDQEVVVDADSDAKIVTTDLGDVKRINAVNYLVNARGKSATSATNIPGPHTSGFYGTGYIDLPNLGSLEVSRDGINFSEVCLLRPRYRGHDTWGEITVAFPPTEGRFFRLVFKNWQIPGKKDDVLKLYKARLLSGNRIDNWEVKAALRADYDYGDSVAFDDDGDALCSRNIRRLQLAGSDSVDVGGLSEGCWRIMRFYNTSTGAKTKHGRKECLGLECDRLSAEAALKQWNCYIKPITDSLQLANYPLWGVTMDSHEAGSQNWTRLMPQHFANHHGYDILDYLPVLAGSVVDSRAKSDSVLRDLRISVSRLIASEFYGSFNRLCAERGLHFTAQAIGNALCLSGDQLLAKKYVDRPQGEFWSIHPDGSYDVKDCSSAAHIYGKRIASGEAFTDAKYSEPLSHFKRLADCAYANGINEFVVCASAHQPWMEIVPGNTAGGRQYCLNRNNPYMALSQGFWLYQSRCAWMLRQGLPVIDYCVYLGDDAPVKTLSYRLPVAPHGHDFDVVTSDALLSRFSTDGKGMISLPDGMQYSALIVPSSSLILPESAAALQRLAENGADVIFGDTIPSPAFLPRDIIAPDTCIRFSHRRTHDSDIYFVYNHGSRPVSGLFSFRCQRPNVCVFDPMDGCAVAANGSSHDIYSDVNFSLEPWQSLFVVFTDSVASLPRQSSFFHSTDISEGWNLNIADKSVDGLGDWTQIEDCRVRYFSGLAEYSRILSFDKKTGCEYYIRPHLLNVAARVWINGNDCGYVWASPYRLNITDYLVNGENEIRIEVSNSLVNRIVGNLNGEAPCPGTFSTTEFCTADTPLVPSGITGCELLELEF